MKKRALFVLALCLFFSGCTQHLPLKYEHDITAKELIDFQFKHSGFEDSFLKNIASGALPSIRQNIQKLLKRELTYIENNALEKVIVKAVNRVYSENLYKKPLTKFYQQHYTTKEITDIFEFYNTPTGQKTLRLTKKLLSKIDKIDAAITTDKKDEFSDMFVLEFQKTFLDSKENSK